MSNKNYHKMYNTPKAEVVEEVADQEVEITETTELTETTETTELTETTETVIEPEVQMAIEEVAEPEVLTPEEPEQPVTAIVVNCAKLNVREEPSPRAEVVAVIDASNEVVVYDSESFGNYYKVCTASGIEGYCVKGYLELK